MQSKVITRQQAYMYSRYTTKVNPFMNMYKEDFENIQGKQRPFPYLRSSLSALRKVITLGSQVADQGPTWKNS